MKSFLAILRSDKKEEERRGLNVKKREAHVKKLCYDTTLLLTLH